jgi:hypothetical protein
MKGFRVLGFRVSPTIYLGLVLLEEVVEAHCHVHFRGWRGRLLIGCRDLNPRAGLLGGGGALGLYGDERTAKELHQHNHRFIHCSIDSLTFGRPCASMGMNALQIHQQDYTDTPIDSLFV